MLDVNIDRNAGPPLHEQVAAQIRRAIAEGEAGPGERLPLAKDLAAVSQLAAHRMCVPSSAGVRVMSAR